MYSTRTRMSEERDMHCVAFEFARLGSGELASGREQLAARDERAGVGVLHMHRVVASHVGRLAQQRHEAYERVPVVRLPGHHFELREHTRALCSLSARVTRRVNQQQQQQPHACVRASRKARTAAARCMCVR